jgi:hypothetical protein
MSGKAVSAAQRSSGLRLPDVGRPRPGGMAAVGFIGRLLEVAVPSTNHGNRYKLNF